MARQAFSAHSIDCKSWRWKTPKILHGRVQVLNHDAMTTQPRRWSITLVHFAIEKILNGEEFPSTQKSRTRTHHRARPSRAPAPSASLSDLKQRGWQCHTEQRDTYTENS